MNEYDRTDQIVVASMRMAERAALHSKHDTKVGAMFDGYDGLPARLIACNSAPEGIRDDGDRLVAPDKYLFTGHAEERLIALAAKHGIPTLGVTFYVTHPSCARCARMMIDAGVKQVVHGSGVFSQTSAIWGELEAAKTMFKEAGVIVRRLGETDE